MQKLNQYMRVNDSDAKKMLKDIQPTEPFENELLDSFVV